MLGLRDDGPGTVYQHRSQVDVSTPADAQQTLIVTGAALSGCQSQRCRHLLAFLVLLASTDRCNQRRRYQRSDTPQLLQSLGHLVAVGERLDLFIELGFSIIQGNKVAPKAM